MLRNLQTALVLVSCCFSSATVFAAGEVRQVGTSFAPATPFRYTAAGLTHTWGVGENQLIESFSTDDDTFRFASVADRVELVRDDISEVTTGVPCGVFGERAGPSASLLSPDFPNDVDGSGNCDMALMLVSRVVNRGALDLFSNIGPNPKNVERVDYVFDSGTIASFSSDGLEHTGHLVAEKRGNNRLQVAAILSLDAFGQPAEFGPLIRIHEFFDPNESNVRYGETNLRHNYSFFQSNSLSPQAFPVFLADSTETVAMAFLSADRLGISPGQLYFGFSYFGDDVNPELHSLTDVTTFPNTTADTDILPGDGADIYGGVSGFFVSDSVSVGTGAVFIDENGDGLQAINEAGISGLQITLLADTNTNGFIDQGIDMELGSIESATNGGFVLPGLPNGQFLLVLDSADPDLPGGTQVPSDADPLVFVVDNDDPENLNFALVDANIGGGVSTPGGEVPDVDTDDTVDTDQGDTEDATDSPDGAEDSEGGDTEGATDSPDGAEDSEGGDTEGATDPNGDTDDSDVQPGVMTDAVPDVAQLDQGSSVIIDVLANDIDGSGLGLTISSVTNTPNATITEENNLITYTPNFSFFGLDAFTYTVVDGNGVESTGTVSVEVIRFSDINNNGINDFVECGCSSLRLETGVHGVGLGGGASAHWSLLLLLGMFGLLPRSMQAVRRRMSRSY